MNITNLDKIITETKPTRFIDELSCFVTAPDLGGLTPADFKHAPSLVAQTLYLEAFHLATVGSSIYQWLIELYEDYPDLAEFFDQIHAERAAAYVRAALGLFPKGRVPKSLDAKLEFCDKHEAQLRALDKKFKGASEDAIAKFRDYIIAHREVFEAQVEEFWRIRRKRR